MKTKTLVTAFAVSMPLLLGSAYAQTTTTQGGHNRSGDGGAMTTNPGSTTSGSTTTAPGSSTSPATGTTSKSTGSMGASTTTPATASGAASTEAITGWSVKHDMMGKTVYNENNEKIGDINDVVITTDGRAMYLLVGAGGFLGMGEKDVAVPFDRFKRADDRITLSGYSKEQLKALPEVRRHR